MGKTVSEIHLRGARSAQPAASSSNNGFIYCVTDENDILERSNGSAWQAYSPATTAPSGSAGGDLTGTYPNPTVGTDKITFAKMQNISTDRLIGSDTASTGDPEEISVGGGLEFSGSTAIQRSALTGDVTASAGSGSTTIPNDTVTYAKMQNVSAASKLVGRGDSGSGDPEEISLGSGLTMTGTTLAASASGTVTTSGSPASGNLTKFSGAAAITNADLTGDVTTSGTVATTIANDAVTYAKMQDVSGASKLLGRGSSGSGNVEEISLGSGLSMSGTTISSVGADNSLDYVEITSDVTISGSSGSPTTIVTSSSISYSGSQTILISFYAAVVGAGTNTCVFELYEDSTSLGRIAQVSGGATISFGIFGQLKRTPSNASHTYTVKAWKNAGTDFSLGANAGTYLPCFIRIITIG